jgi:hypothetical protein
MKPGGALILDVREWHSTVVRKTQVPVFETTIETDRGRLTFRSVTTLQPETQCLLIHESHVLESRSCPRIVEYDFVMRGWTQDELIAGLIAAGFESLQFFGDYDASPVGATDRIVVVATRGRHPGER